MDYRKWEVPLLPAMLLFTSRILTSFHLSKTMAAFKQNCNVINLIELDNIYIIKQDSHIYVPYSRPNGWTDWAEILCGHSGVAGGCYRLKNRNFFFLFEKFFFQIFFFTGNAGPFSYYYSKDANKTAGDISATQCITTYSSIFKSLFENIHLNYPPTFNIHSKIWHFCNLMV